MALRARLALAAAVAIAVGIGPVLMVPAGTAEPPVAEQPGASTQAVESPVVAPQGGTTSGPAVAPQGTDSTVAEPRVATATVAELPGGGTTIVRGKTYVALYGHPATGALGVLGEQGTTATIRRAKRIAASYEPHTKRTVVPALEIIATVASSSAGKDGDYSNESTIATLRPLVDAAGRSGVYVVLDLQPGRTDFLTQATRYRSLLLEPHVGLALDPEWRLKPNQRHLRQIGSVDAREINRVVDWLADLTREEALPQKMLLLHQFRTSMIRNRSALDTSRDELAVVIQMDGLGSQPAKRDTWRAIRAKAPDGVVFGWKNFNDEDRPMLSPAATMRVKPQPRWVSYQ